MGLSKFSLEDFTLRKPEQVVDNPFMRFIGFIHPVRFYKNVVLIREQSRHGLTR